MTLISDDGAVIVDMRQTYPATFTRDFTVTDSGELIDWAYHDAEFLIWQEGQEKVLENFSLTNNKLVVTGLGGLRVSENLTLNLGVFRYHFLIEYPSGERKVIFKGNFIYKR